MPVKTTIVDLKKEWESGNRSLFSRTLVEKIGHALSAKKQVILYLNKRGFSSAFTCLKCGESIHCPHCDVTLTLHKESAQRRFLLCHVCGRVVKVPTSCPSCNSTNVKFVGVGTQKVAETLSDMFPRAKVVRADRDTTRTKASFEAIYRDLHEGKVDILVGTQIIAKGLDLGNVALIGVPFADVGLHVPDFRASERVFQSIMQVAGRTGRLGRKGEVVIQTLLPNDSAILAAAKGDYEAFYEATVRERKKLNYPPFTRIIKLAYVDADEQKAIRAAKTLSGELQWLVDNDAECKGVAEVAMAPASPVRMHDKYHYHVILRGKNPRMLLDRVKLARGWRVDVDPVSIA